MQYLDSLAATREMDVDLVLPGHGDPITAALWGNIAVTQADLTLSEVLGHTDLLMSEGRVREVQDGEVVRFESALI